MQHQYSSDSGPCSDSSPVEIGLNLLGSVNVDNICMHFEYSIMSYCTVLFIHSVARFLRWVFGTLPQQVGRYGKCLRPKQALTTLANNRNKTLWQNRWIAVYVNFEPDRVNLSFRMCSGGEYVGTFSNLAMYSGLRFDSRAPLISRFMYLLLGGLSSALPLLLNMP